MYIISKEQAKSFLIKYHHLHTNWIESDEGLLEYVEKIGCIQYDPLNVVGRNPDLVLQSRVKNYKSRKLEKMLYQERSLIDGWDKMMSIYPSSKWQAYGPIRESMTKDMERILTRRSSIDALKYIDDVKAHLVTSGPILSSKIDLGSAGRGTWGHSKVSSVVMDYLFHKGRVGVYNKRNTQKIYDLMENLRPNYLEELETLEKYHLDHDAFLKWYVKRRIKSIGFLWNKSGGGWLGQYISKKSVRTLILEMLLEEEAVIMFKIEGIEEAFYIAAEDYESLMATEVIKSNKRIRFIAPLDNLIWDRGLLDTLFEFKYTWEVYTPIVKRQYGYYVLPILYGTNFIGRIEFEKQRGDEVLRIKNCWLEPGIKASKTLSKEMTKALKLFAKYLGAQAVIGEEKLMMN